MTEWEYRKIDLGQQRPRSDEFELLNAAGADRWELVGITTNNIAYLKRPLDETPATAAYDGGATTVVQDVNTTADERGAGAQEVEPKYRDRETNETWSGRGRTANWLERKQDAGEDIEKYLVWRKG